MGNWGSDTFIDDHQVAATTSSLQGVVNQLPTSLRQAMFAAASTTTIKRGTWTGCAMNAAGAEVGEKVSSSIAAAKSFGTSATLVDKFISIWDRLEGTDAECTQLLRDTIEKAGLFVEPGKKNRPPRIYRVKVYEDQQKKLREQFDALMVANMIPDTELALELLTA